MKKYLITLSAMMMLGAGCADIQRAEDITPMPQSGLRVYEMSQERCYKNSAGGLGQCIGFTGICEKTIPCLDIEYTNTNGILVASINVPSASSTEEIAAAIKQDYADYQAEQNAKRAAAQVEEAKKEQINSLLR